MKHPSDIARPGFKPRCYRSVVSCATIYAIEVAIYVNNTFYTCRRHLINGAYIFFAHFYLFPSCIISRFISVISLLYSTDLVSSAFITFHCILLPQPPFYPPHPSPCHPRPHLAAVSIALCQSCIAFIIVNRCRDL